MAAAIGTVALTVGALVASNDRTRSALGDGPVPVLSPFRLSASPFGATSAQVEYWRSKARANRKTASRYRRLLFKRSSTTTAIELACTVYGNCATLWRKARCETGGTFNPRSRNSSSGAAGLFQFLASTWASTPFARLSVWDPYANALAAGWMHAHGRAGEWSCR